MKLLLDENLPHQFRHELPGHEATTVVWMGWDGISNGALLDLAEAHGYEAFITGDQSLPFQQKAQHEKTGHISAGSSKPGVGNVDAFGA